jgi:hypothetical protein
MMIETLAHNFVIACSVDQTNTSLPTILPTSTKPSGDSGTATGGMVANLADDGAVAQNFLHLVGYGVGSATTFSVDVYGYKMIKPTTAGQVDLWVPILLVSFTFTLATSGATAPTGVAGTPIGTGSSYLFATGVTVRIGSTLVGEAPSESLISPGANPYIATGIVDLKGCKKFSLQFSTGGSATSCNALWSLL